MKPKTIIVDEDDKVIGHKKRETLEKEDIYRTSALWLTNSDGEILLAQRQRTKTHYPLRWGPAVAGTVDEGESYESNIIKETEEEIGLTDVELKKNKKLFHEGKWIHFTQWYTLTIDKEANEFKIRKEEVEQVKWFTKAEILEKYNSDPEEFVDSIKEAIDMFVM